MEMQAQIPHAQIKNGNMLAEELLNAISKRNPSPPSAPFAKSTPAHQNTGVGQWAGGATALPETIAKSSGQVRKPATLQGIMIAAINRIKSVTTADERQKITACYGRWSEQLKAGDDSLLKSRGGKLWMYHNILPIINRYEADPRIMTAISQLFHALAYRDQLIERNPDYTGQPWRGGRFRRKINGEESK